MVNSYAVAHIDTCDNSNYAQITMHYNSCNTYRRDKEILLIDTGVFLASNVRARGLSLPFYYVLLVVFYIFLYHGAKET